MKYPLIAVLLLTTMAGCARLEEPTVSWYLAVSRGDLEQVERHIHWNTDVNSALPSGSYALHDAAAKGRYILTELLLENGADTGLTDRQGRTPLEVAILNGRTQVARRLMKAGAELDPDKVLLEATKTGVEDRDIVAFLKAAGANLEATEKNGDTPLLIAVRQDNHRLVYHLLEYGADVNARNAAGETPLLIARRADSPEVVDHLLRYGAMQP